MHGSHSSEDEPLGEMNLIPLIDIALTLLIIMMVTTTFVRRPGVTLRLPETRTREGAPEISKDQTIAIAPDGTLFMDGLAMSERDVQRRMSSVYAVNPQARILIKADRTVPYARVMTALDIVRQSGLVNVTLPTDALPAGRELGTPNSAPAPAGTLPPASVPPSANALPPADALSSSRPALPTAADVPATSGPDASGGAAPAVPTAPAPSSDTAGSSRSTPGG